MKLLAVLVLVAAVFAADPPEVATGVPAVPNYTRFSLEEDLAKEMSTIAPADSEPPSINISELHANHNTESTPAAEPEPTTKHTFIMKITTKSPMLQALMNETMEEHDGMKPSVEEIVPKPASVKPVEGAHEMRPMEGAHEMKPVDEMKPVEAMKSTEKPHEETKVTPKPMMEEHDDDEHYQNDSPPHEPQPEPEPEPEPEEDKKTPKPVSPTQKPQPTPSSKDKTSASSQLVSNTTKSHSAASSLSPSVVLATIAMALISRLAC